jgi:hypothetical protein
MTTPRAIPSGFVEQPDGSYSKMKTAKQHNMEAGVGEVEICTPKEGGRRTDPVAETLIEGGAPNYDHHNKNPRKDAVVESNPGNEPLGAGAVQKEGDARFHVRLTSVRKRLLDEDNLCEKYLVDCCRYAGLIPQDSPDQTRITVAQRKAAKGEEEHTLIEITLKQPTTKDPL